MEATTVVLDETRQAKAREYARTSRRLFVVDLALSGLYVLIWLLAGLAPWWRDQVHSLTTNPWLAVPLFALGFGLLLGLIGAPLSYYSGFVLPHRYGLSTQTPGAWLWDRAKGALLGGVLGGVILEVMYWLLRVAPQSWWLWTAGVMLLFTVVLGLLAPVLIFPLFYKFKPLADEELTQRLTRLAEQAGTRVRGVYSFDMSSKTTAANAAVMGLGRTRRIVLGDTLLDNFSADEIETVLAHELGHHVHGDLGKGVLVQSALTLAGLWLAHLVMSWGVAFFRYEGLADPATLPLLALAFGVFGLATMPLGNAYSRWRERLADSYALATTRKPTDFASAMTRLANQNLTDADPEPWVEFLFASHPSISRRVAMAQAFARANGAGGG